MNREQISIKAEYEETSTSSGALGCCARARSGVVHSNQESPLETGTRHVSHGWLAEAGAGAVLGFPFSVALVWSNSHASIQQPDPVPTHATRPSRYSYLMSRLICAPLFGENKKRTTRNISSVPSPHSVEKFTEPAVSGPWSRLIHHDSAAPGVVGGFLVRWHWQPASIEPYKYSHRTISRSSTRFKFSQAIVRTSHDHVKRNLYSLYKQVISGELRGKVAAV